MSQHASARTLDSRLDDYCGRNDPPRGQHAEPRTLGDVWPVTIFRDDTLTLVSAQLHESIREGREQALRDEARMLNRLILKS